MHTFKLDCHSSNDDMLDRWRKFVVFVNLKKTTPNISSLATVLPAKSDSDVMFCLHLLGKALTCTLQLS